MKNILKVLFGIAVCVLVIATLSFSICASMQRNERICTVSEKYVKQHEKSSRYLVVCDDTTYKVEDDFFEWKFNSSDTYAKIKIGSTYKLKTKGKRIAFLSEYENINDIIEQ